MIARLLSDALELLARALAHDAAGPLAAMVAWWADKVVGGG